MSLPTSETIPDDFNSLTPAQKRRIRYSLHNASQDEINVFVKDLKRRLTLSFDFFLYSLLGAIFCGLGIFLDSPVMLVAAIAIIPFISTLPGISLAIKETSLRFLLQSLVGYLIAVIFFFGFGCLAGFISKFFPTRVLTVVPLLINSSYLTWIILIVTSIITGILIIRREDNPKGAGLVLSFLTLLYFSAAGMFLIIGNESAFAKTLKLGGLHTLVIIFLLVLTFLILGLRPQRFINWLVMAAIIVATLILVPAYLIGKQEPINGIQTKPFPTLTPTSTITATITPLPPTETSTNTPTVTNTSTTTPTNTLTPTATAISMFIDSTNGAYIRESPDFEAKIVGYALDGSVIYVFSEKQEINGYVWVKVLTTEGNFGWILQSLIGLP